MFIGLSTAQLGIYKISSDRDSRSKQYEEDRKECAKYYSSVFNGNLSICSGFFILLYLFFPFPPFSLLFSHLLSSFFFLYSRFPLYSLLLLSFLLISVYNTLSPWIWSNSNPIQTDTSPPAFCFLEDFMTLDFKSSFDSVFKIAKKIKKVELSLEIKKRLKSCVKKKNWSYSN